MKKLALILTLALATGFAAQAATITNGSFELPTNTTNNGGVGPTGFVTTTDGGYFESHGTGVYTGTHGALAPEDGLQYLQLSGAGSSVYQDLGALDANSTYTLTIGIGKNNYSGPHPEAVVSLLNGTNLSGSTLGSYDTTAFTFNSDPNGVTQFSDVTFTFTTGATVSGDITFAIQTSNEPAGTNPAGSSTVSFDDARLVESGGSPAVPEPSTWALVFGGLGLLIGVQQFRRRSSQI